jgi:ornithine lipid ester-linked acyl 2-hydroxylase
VFYEAPTFPFTADLETHWETIRDELSHLRQGWDIFGLYAFGVKVSHNCHLCPETTKLVERIPNLMTAGFSALASGTHIAPHNGHPDGVLRCHLGLIVPQDCGIRVGEEIQVWQEGKCLVFNDTVEHEAWNKGDRTRVVLLLDFKAPPGFLPETKKSKGGLFGLFKRT